MHFIDLGADLVADYGGGMSGDELLDRELMQDQREQRGEDAWDFEDLDVYVEEYA